MFRFQREKVLPLFLGKMTTVFDVARRAGVDSRVVNRAVNGEPISAAGVQKIADALGVDAMEYLEPPNFATRKKRKSRRAGGEKHDRNL